MEFLNPLPLFNNDTETRLRHTNYHLLAEGTGVKEFFLDKPEDINDIFAKAKDTARSGTAVLINGRSSKTDFRKGSISMQALIPITIPLPFF